MFIKDIYHTKPFLHLQKDISARARSILVDWLIEIHYKFKLQPSSIWLTINILDRYLSKKSLPRSKLQLVGAVSFLIACKFEEVYPPEVRDCVFIADNAYTRDDVLETEQQILEVLDYQICVPTGYHFLTRYLNIINASDRVRYLSFYYAERSFQESEIFDYKPSHYVAAALYAALVYEAYENDPDRFNSDPPISTSEQRSIWPSVLIDECGYDESDLSDLAKKLVHHVHEEPHTSSNRHLVSAKKKYMHDKYLNVADLIHPVYG